MVGEDASVTKTMDIALHLPFQVWHSPAPIDKKEAWHKVQNLLNFRNRENYTKMRFLCFCNTTRSKCDKFLHDPMVALVYFIWGVE